MIAYVAKMLLMAIWRADFKPSNNNINNANNSQDYTVEIFFNIGWAHGLVKCNSALAQRSLDDDEKCHNFVTASTDGQYIDSFSSIL